MVRSLKVGIVGAGVGEGYVAGFQRQLGVEVAALCARTVGRLEPLALKYGIPRTYTDYESMLAQEPLDAVVIATPNYLHHSMTMAALDAGKHVICDKPLALNAAQAQEMLERATHINRKHFVPFVWHFVPAARYVKEIVESGFLGQLYHVNVRYFNLSWGDAHGPMRWQFDKEKAGSGAISNIGSHAIHLLQWWLGDIDSVCAVLGTAVKERKWPDGTSAKVDVDDNVAFLANLANGATAVFNASMVTLVARNFLQIDLFGSDGSLIFLDDWGAEDAAIGRIYAMRKNEQVPAKVIVPERLTGEFLDMPSYHSPFRSCFALMAAEFVDAIRQDRPADPGFDAGLRVQRVIDAVIQSAAEERWTSC